MTKLRKIMQEVLGKSEGLDQGHLIYITTPG